MRKLTDHIIFNNKETVRIDVLDQPGQGNANHEYSLEYSDNCIEIFFQNGPIKECGINGITNESLLSIVVDRLRGFQSGNFKCRENAIALTKLEEALMWLKKRTNDRMIRGVEGKI